MLHIQKFFVNSVLLLHSVHFGCVMLYAAQRPESAVHSTRCLCKTMFLHPNILHKYSSRNVQCCCLEGDWLSTENLHWFHLDCHVGGPAMLGSCICHGSAVSSTPSCVSYSILCSNYVSMTLESAHSSLFATVPLRQWRLTALRRPRHIPLFTYNLSAC